MSTVVVDVVAARVVAVLVSFGVVLVLVLVVEVVVAQSLTSALVHSLGATEGS